MDQPVHEHSRRDATCQHCCNTHGDHDLIRLLDVAYGDIEGMQEQLQENQVTFAIECIHSDIMRT